ncbi:MAG TPA: 3-hydroxybutyryl-CoA dehydrogenase, partial [Pseudomonadales bacterium]|nr:3-hydroxybutyryl-CoA dehydrogenase [Pseudomonadales bacterium]
MSLKNIGVIGAGTMGNGIAQTCAIRGYNVIMQDVSDKVA